jgi:outer membrane protein assembly factor BamE (lipoprotein component of BamABCDE complex)
MPRVRRSLLLAAGAAATLGLLAGCQSAADHAAAVRQAQGSSDQKLTVGTVQREIRVGMSSADVVQVLGAPNMVTTDDKRRESWVYDKISTESAYSTSSGGVSALVLGGGIVGSALLGGAGTTGYQSAAGAGSTSQRTLTIIVKFDENSRVRDFSYRSSSF